ncbi:S-adenosyl-L-methionine-dependent methyltransferase [Pseudovirgaria hyperparasitica]|uniref:S-adenosyl-L-methionine-dependent methyltransferase n=1 Tax=Pseudovirgaria hyperparasitica TaxID=470096 RepID=A0A6A6W643_9PEZI|nr:S-adenosyl-L-methionine-dependent methyltransferase [Pseudovirgaria hyperparasitica]KAF2757494.1 S-adenosyl-L-methionine-dependent methyltransferase [Pseudovirgaria hyperparasitica]
MGAGQSTPRIVELAASISENVAKIQEILDAQGAPMPSFDEDSPPLPKEIAGPQHAVLDATAELQDLLQDPMNFIHRSSRSDKPACINTIVRFDIAALVPCGGRTSFQDISRQTPLTEQMVGRIVRHAATMRIFKEPEPGQVMHTKASKLLANHDFRDWARTGIEEMGPAGGRLADALERWPGSQHPNQTGFSLANDTNDSIYEVVGKDPSRAARFGSAMKVMTARPEFDLAYGVNNYDWGALGKALVVDVGGSKGHFAIALARRYENLRFIVQDMAHMLGDGPEEISADRLEFMAHSLFDPQSVQADVFIFRWVFHNWSDEYCVRILKAQLPSMKPGARLILLEAILPESGTVGYWKESELRSLDLEMASTFNARERTLSDWKALFALADPGFVLRSVVEPEGSAMAVLEFFWERSSA